jgi:phage tail sheath protein FI
MAALTDMRMPGVYTQEIATLPPSVPAIASAVPVFIGYTQTALKKGQDLTLVPTRIKSMKDYTDWFGQSPNAGFTIAIDTRVTPTSTTSPSNPDIAVVKSSLPYYMYHSLLFYFANGGGPCYIVSVGDFTEAPDKDVMTAAIPAIKKVRDITIIYFADAYSLDDADQGTVIGEALEHCDSLNDPNRVTLIDLDDANGDDLDKIAAFLATIPQDENLKYGMVYGPSMETVFTATYADTGVIIGSHLQTTPDAATATALTALSTATGTAYTNANAAATTLKSAQDTDTALKGIQKWVTDFKTANPAATDAQVITALDTTGPVLTGNLKAALAVPNANPVTIVGQAVTDADTAVGNANTANTTAQGAYTTALGKQKAGVTSATDSKVYINYTNMDLVTVGGVSNIIYNKVKDAIKNFGIVLPPGGAMAGIFFRTDAAQGVWKAPANVGVLGAISPMVDFDDDDHANLNVPDNGRAVNLIRNYPGRGVLVYGARTLTGNDNEWRYVNVRRTFCFIEDSVYRAMQDFVFAPNTSETWIKVRAMINSFLSTLWKAGGLFGATPADAYQVTVGVPDTMSVDDMLNGIMIVYIKVAVARPAEFIVLRYEHLFSVPQS